MGRSSLTPEIATALESYWEISGDTLSDEQICERVIVKRTRGEKTYKEHIRFTQLRGWLQRNTKVTRESGVREGLRDIRARAKAKTKAGYLQRIVSIVMEAHVAAKDAFARARTAKGTPYDFTAAAKLLDLAGKYTAWLAERQFPLDFHPQRLQPKTQDEQSTMDRVRQALGDFDAMHQVEEGNDE